MRVGIFVARLDQTPSATSPLFTDTERRYCLGRRYPEPHLAGRYAAKRAASLALGLSEEDEDGILGDIEVAREPGCAPTLHFHRRARHLGGAGATSHVSISHSGNYAVALVVIE